MTDGLPARFSEPYFRKYEPYIKTICDQWPKPIDFQVFGSVTTFACRLRDAMRSLHENKWKTDVNMTVFNTVYRSPKDKDFVVQEQPNHIVKVKDKNLVTNGNTLKVEAKVVDQESTAPNPPVELLHLSLHAIETACLLSHHRLLNGPVLLAMSSTDAKTFLAKYDILLEEQTEGKYLLT